MVRWIRCVTVYGDVVVAVDVGVVVGGVGAAVLTEEPDAEPVAWHEEQNVWLWHCRHFAEPPACTYAG